MPIYEYHCRQCNTEFEQLVFSGKAKVKCPKCASRRVRRKLSVFSMSGSNKNSDQHQAGASCSSCQASSCTGCRK